MRLAAAYAAAVVFGVGYALLGLPVQLSDSLGNMAKAQDLSLGDLVYGEFFQASFLRPFLWAHLKLLLILSGGDYFTWFRGWHVLQVALLIWLYLRVVRPVTPAGAAAVPLGLAALVGGHTFVGTVYEAFPINTFMTILLCVYAGAALALGPPGRWRDVAAAALLVFAALTVESGLLVGVVVIAARMAGATGVSRAGTWVQVVLIGGYFALRFLVLDVGAPGLTERSSGFGFSVLDPDELLARFGGNPMLFYAYNVLSGLSSILFAEPQSGVWAVTGAVRAGEVRLADLVGVLASAGGTCLIAGYLWARRAAWRAWSLDADDRIVAVFLAVAAANAAIGFAYSKDVILSPAGAFFALALTVAVRRLIQDASPTARLRSAVVGILLLALSSAWAVRGLHLHAVLRAEAENARNDWAYADQWIEEQGMTFSPAGAELKRRLEADAVVRLPARAPVSSDLMEALGID
jgi:hypothetical protein